MGSPGTAGCADGASLLHPIPYREGNRERLSRDFISWERFSRDFISWGGGTGSLCIPEGFCWQVGQVWPLPDVSLEFKLLLGFQNKRILTPALITFTALALRQDGCGTQCSA